MRPDGLHSSCAMSTDFELTKEIGVFRGKILEWEFTFLLSFKNVMQVPYKNIMISIMNINFIIISISYINAK